MSVTWQEDWETFIDTVAALVRSGGTNKDLADRFGGSSVRWTGVLSEKKLDGDSRMVGINFQKREWDLGGGRKVSPRGFLLSVPDHAVPQWRSLPVGAPVTFTATLGAKGAVFPPIQIRELTETETVLMLRPTEGVPV